MSENLLELVVDDEHPHWDALYDNIREGRKPLVQAPNTSKPPPPLEFPELVVTLAGVSQRYTLACVIGLQWSLGHGYITTRWQPAGDPTPVATTEGTQDK